MLDYSKSFIEVQFPVSKISKESYKERKAGAGQTLTGLGKWWGRKPLILVRACILGLLMPVSDNPKKDREIFLKILTMDQNGLLLRKEKNIALEDIYNLLTANEKKRYFEDNDDGIKLKDKFDRDELKQIKDELQAVAFERLSYDQKLTYCRRPEEIELNDKNEWNEINNYLEIKAYNLPELIEQLGMKKFGKRPSVGDCFAGGGSVPFEAARIGCDVFASDLNPIAGLLTWASLNIIGAPKEEVEQLKKFQKTIYDMADKQITEWRIEHNEKSGRAIAYLYCVESLCPECGFRVPLAPSWIIGTKTKTIAILKENTNEKRFDILIKSNAANSEIEKAEEMATVKSGALYCPHCLKSTPISALRKDKKDENGNTANELRKWEKNEFLPRPDDIFQERLYCIRYEYEKITADSRGKEKKVIEREYQAPDSNDLKREEKVIKLLNERFNEWQEKGYIPDSQIEGGDKTDEPIRTRGWQYWHQLFNPRQLLVNGLLMELVDENAETEKEKIIGLLGVAQASNWNSRLSTWINDDAHPNTQTFNNQALNTLFNYGNRSFPLLEKIWFITLKNCEINTLRKILLQDARKINDNSDLWITDPPYADAVNYHELTEFFLAWDKKILLKIFPEWYGDSKRALAVKGTGESFNKSMVEVYRNLANNMPQSGMQVIMFTHQDVAVWAELAYILWASGLQVTAAWNIATETESGGLKSGNYVKGTVILVLRKQQSDKTAFLDELYVEIEERVKKQIDSMRSLDDKDDPNFADPDYLLAAYAASLEVLTSYKNIEDINIEYELSKTRVKGAVSPIGKIINDAVKIAYDYMIPGSFDNFIWKTLTPEERFYIKGLELEKNNNYQLSSYQELARGFGVDEYDSFLASKKANHARLKTATEFSMKGMNDSSKFGASILRNILSAIYQAVKAEDTAAGRNWLKNELPDYWGTRKTIIEMLDYISSFEPITNMAHWHQDSYYAKLLRELVNNDMM